jgi:DNA (cytosine-5)-methyltransferase 1
MRELALFAGAGGGLLGSRLLGWKTVCYVEWEPFCIDLIKARIKDGCLEDAPIWDDVRSFDGRPWRGRVDVISAGFPCQPFSNSGKRKAGDDARNMWPETIRIIKEVGPAFALLENVPGLRAKSHGYFGQVLRDLAACGYDARWDCIPASALGAPHQRDRLWIVAYPNGAFINELRGLSQGERNLGNNDKFRVKANWNGFQFKRANATCRKGLLPPAVSGVDDGLADRLDRLKAVANGQVPQVVKFVWDSMTIEAEMVGKLVTKVA